MSGQVRNLFELKPKQARSFEESSDGTVEILIPRYGNNAMGRLLKRVLNDRPVRIHLDDIGTSVWHLCDGHRNVHEIGQSLQAKFGERIEPVYDRLETFLKQMNKADLIEWEN